MGPLSSLGSYIVKLRGRPKGSATKRGRKRVRGRVNDPWYGYNAGHEPSGEMDNPQPSPKALELSDAVHRLNGNGPVLLV